MQDFSKVSHSYGFYCLLVQEKLFLIENMQDYYKVSHSYGQLN
ncbi:hypothetical protein T4B_8954 [Trichinella pseudospiralis]|uniref:Uncharacterized protein n=1 Tax=Trichinella pseudospiralis TaxID=6337 RepID=A0A0V1GBC7_TRIPS|nr:hypothetical protein T4B_8954 [Trichinella pseudospiralis]